MKRYIYTILLLIISLHLHAQSALIKGTVIDRSSGRPVTFASVYALQSGWRTTSDDSGHFNIHVGNTDTLSVQRIGYIKKLIPVKESTLEPLIVQLTPADTSGLRDIELNTGYQTIPKERATGSFVQIDNKLISRSVGPDILDRLRGITSSLLFDDDPNHPPMSIRGLSTLTKNGTVAAPLIIVDNFPYTGDINNINPNDVENITVLRDAAAASIWGAKAGNGVIVITMKQARQNQPTHLSINSNITVQDKPDLFAVSQMTTTDFIDVEKYLFDQGFYNAKLNNKSSYPVVSPVVQILQAQKLGQISSDAAGAAINKLQNIDVRNGYLKYFYQRATMQQYSAVLSGGKNNIAYLTSIGYDKDLSSPVGNKNDRITWHSGLILQPVRKLSLQTSAFITWTRSAMNSPLPVIPAASTTLYPYTSFVDADGRPAAIEKDFLSSFKDTAGGGHLLDWDYVPLDELHNADNTASSMDLLLNEQVTYNIFPALKAEAKYQFERQQTTQRNYYSTRTYYTRNLINLFSSVNNGIVTYGIPVGGILDLGSTQATTHNVRAQLDYDQNFSSRHHITALAGWEIRQTNTTGNTTRTYGYNDNNLTYTNINYAVLYPILDGLPFSKTIPNPASFTGLLDRMVSLYANAAYNYNDLYTFSFSARKDASNILGTATNNKWKPLWSAGAAWDLSNEQFYHVSWLPSLKLRATYGYSGNVNNTISALTTLSYIANNYSGISTLPYAMVSNPPNPDLSWEKIGTLNLAADFTIGKGIFDGTVEYYTKKSTDVIAIIPADVTLGSPTFTRNSADLKGRGLDITLNSTIIDRTFRWRSSLLISYDKVLVSKYLQAVTPSSFINTSGESILPIVGKPPYTVASYKWGGLNPANGNPIGYLNGDTSEDYTSIITKAGWKDVVISGSAVPQWFGGLRNTFSYKQFQLSFNITYKLGYYFRKNTISYNGLFTGGAGNGDFEKRWKQPGDERRTDVPSMIYPDNYNRDAFYTKSAATIESGDQIRLQDIQFSYDIPAKLGRPAIQLYLYGNNLGLIWRKNKDHLDPDSPNSYPQPKSCSAGCKISF